MAHLSPLAGHYVTIEVPGGECKGFFLENGEGRPLVCQAHRRLSQPPLARPAGGREHENLPRDRIRSACRGKSDPPHNREWWKEEYRLAADYYTVFIVSF